MRIAELADQVGGAHQLAFFVVGVVRLVRRRKPGELDGARDPLGIEDFDFRNTVHHEQFRAIDVIGQQCRVGRTARQFGLVAFGVDDVTVIAVAFENAAHIADVVQQTGDQQMGVIAGIGRRQQRPAFHDVVADHRHQHGVFDVVIKRVAVADAFDR